MPTMTLAQALRNALDIALERDDRVMIFGEDVGKRGGVFTITEGLQEKYGEMRVFDTPLDELGILGMGVGLAAAGMRPVAEIQFIDYIWPGFDALYSEAAKLRFRSGGRFAVPLVVRSPYGGRVKGGLYHSQSPETLFVHTAGLKVVIPSNPYDAKGLLLAAIADDNPVVFLEHKRMYFMSKGEVPEGYYEEPIGKAKVVREGSDVTLIAYGMMVLDSLEAAKTLEKEGISVEVIDLRSLMPFDGEAILNSVAKTGHLVTVHEAPRTLGFAAEVAAFVAERAIEYLDGPIVRVTGWDMPFPYILEDAYMPNPVRIVRGVKKALNLL